MSFALRAARPAVLAICALSLFAVLSRPASSDEDHGGDDHAEEEAAPRVFTPQEMAEAGIVVEAVVKQPLPELFRAPGEVTVDMYGSSLVSPRVAGTVIKRHATIGDHVAAGTPLVRLFSAEMAEAQAAFVIAFQEHRRLAGARGAVTNKEREQAAIAMSEARARLRSYGFSETGIVALETGGLDAVPPGEFDLAAPQAGLVLAEDFRLGEVVEAGKVIGEIAAAGAVWVEAHVSPLVAGRLRGDTAKILAGGDAIDARVLHSFRKLDEATRTVVVRLAAQDTDGLLRPGAFVDVQLFGPDTPVLAVPTEAVLRGADGDWTVQVEHTPGQFEPAEVTVLYAAGDRTAIEGIAEGTRIAVKGAFFIAAEAAKSGFDAHAH